MMNSNPTLKLGGVMIPKMMEKRLFFWPDHATQSTSIFSKSAKLISFVLFVDFEATLETYSPKEYSHLL